MADGGAAAIVFWAGAVDAVLLIGLLLATIRRPALRFWPTPGSGSWQSYLFWPLFRGLNVLAFAEAAVDRSAGIGAPSWLRIVAFGVLAASLGVFVYAFRLLGADKSYGARGGLKTDGIYGFSRNPQNTMLMLVYGALAVAADGWPTYLLAGAMMAAYAMMVLAEEPWLVAAYGADYQRYAEAVPRFFHWRQAIASLLGLARRD